MRAIMVCVDYWDYLAVTLPLNKHHFDEIIVVSSPEDTKTRAVCEMHSDKVLLCVTDSFYHQGADFNKWKALEEVIDLLWDLTVDQVVCIMDADVIWPKLLPGDFVPEFGRLYTPCRRMFYDFKGEVPPESKWTEFPLHRNQGEFAGYSQIFHTQDPVLVSHGRPWHDINWKHAGGADSFFQQLWWPVNKIRPGFEVLHLGVPGHNWCGRSVQYLDGTEPANAEARAEQLRGYFRGRRKDTPGPRFQHEKLT